MNDNLARPNLSSRIVSYDIVEYVEALEARIVKLEAQLAAVPKWNPLTTTNRPDDGVFAIWIRRPIRGDVLINYLDVGFEWAPYDIPSQVES